MLRRIAIGLCVLVVSGCDKGGSPGADPPRPAAVTEPASSTPAPTAAAPSAAADPAASCAEACYERRQMEATSAEKIRASCRAECDRRD